MVRPTYPTDAEGDGMDLAPGGLAGVLPARRDPFGQDRAHRGTGGSVETRQRVGETSVHRFTLRKAKRLPRGTI